MIPMTTVGIVIIVEGASYFTSRREYLPTISNKRTMNNGNKTF